MRTHFVLLLLLLSAYGAAQTDTTKALPWSKTRRLQVSDFAIKVGNVSGSYSFAQFNFQYAVQPSLFGLPKDYKQKIRNTFLKGASWIDTSFSVDASVRYQQTLFDMAEVYVRQFRRAVYENRREFFRYAATIEKLNEEIMTAFSKRRVQYDTETAFGTLPDKQKQWEEIIERELNELNPYSAER